MNRVTPGVHGSQAASDEWKMVPVNPMIHTRVQRTQPKVWPRGARISLSPALELVSMNLFTHLFTHLDNSGLL